MSEELEMLDKLAGLGMGYIPTSKKVIQLCRNLERAGLVEPDEGSQLLAVRISAKGERMLLAAQMFGGEDES